MTSTKAPGLTLEEFETRLYRAGRIDGPALLFDAWSGGEIDRQVLAGTIGSVWSGAEYPFRAMTQRLWRELFDAAGYTVDGRPAGRPTEPTRLYRGSTPNLRRRWSWTTDRTMAERFALGTAEGGFMGRMTGNVYVVAAPPESLLCAENGCNEAEYVVDTRGLEIREVVHHD